MLVSFQFYLSRKIYIYHFKEATLFNLKISNVNLPSLVGFKSLVTSWGCKYYVVALYQPAKNNLFVTGTEISKTKKPKILIIKNYIMAMLLVVGHFSSYNSMFHSNRTLHLSQFLISTPAAETVLLNIHNLVPRRISMPYNS